MSAIVVAALLAVGARAGEPRMADFAYTLPVEVVPGHALYALRLPASVYARSTQPDLGDVRVFNGQGDAVPHALRAPRAAPATTPAGIPLPLFPVQVKDAAPDSATSIDIRIGKDGALVRAKTARPVQRAQTGSYLIDATRVDGPIARLAVVLAQPGADVVTRVNVEASDDLKVWSPAATNAPLVQTRFNGAELRELAIPLESTRAKYYRLSPSEPPLPGIGRILAVPPKSEGTRPRDTVTVTGKRGEKDGEYVYETRGTYPADRVFVESSLSNTVMPFELDGRLTASDVWMPVAHGTAYRLVQQGVTLESAAFPVSGPWHRLYRLRLTAAPVPPSPPSLRFEWTPADIVFAAQGEGPFTLAYGSASAPKAALPITSLVPGYGTKSELKVAEAKAGPERVAAGEAATKAATDYRKWGLWAAMALGAAAVAAVALRLMRESSTGRGGEPPGRA